MPIAKRQVGALRVAVSRMVRVFRLKGTTDPHQGCSQLNASELYALMFLGDGGTSTVTALAEELGIVLTTASSLAGRMVRKGWLIRERTETDRRIVRLSLSKSGRSLYQEALEEQMAACQAMLAALSPAERPAFLAMAQKIAGQPEET